MQEWKPLVRAAKFLPLGPCGISRANLSCGRGVEWQYFGLALVHQPGIRCKVPSSRTAQKREVHFAQAPWSQSRHRVARYVRGGRGAWSDRGQRGIDDACDDGLDGSRPGGRLIVGRTQPRTSRVSRQSGSNSPIDTVIHRSLIEVGQVRHMRI